MIFHIFLPFSYPLQQKIIKIFNTRHFWEMLMMITYGLGFIVIPIDVSFIFGSKRLDNKAIWEITSAIGNLNQQLLRICFFYFHFLLTNFPFLPFTLHFHHVEMSFV